MGLINSCSDNRQASLMGTVSGPTLMTTPTTMGGADFTIPSKIFSSIGSYTFAYPPQFPYFKAAFTRSNRAGTMMAGNWTPSAVKTFIDNDTQYPYATTTAPGFIRANVGPKGMAGPAPQFQRTAYTFTNVNSAGVFSAVAKITQYVGGPASTNPTYGGYTSAVNQNSPTSTGELVFLEPNIWAFTGTLTVSQPPPVAPTTYFIKTAMDDRTPAGASGTIQVISAFLTHQYEVTPLPPPLDGTGTITRYKSGQSRAQLTTFQFVPVPEPGQIVLLGAGVLGLAGIWMRRRR
jgi:hypothetical protein